MAFVTLTFSGSCQCWQGKLPSPIIVVKTGKVLKKDVHQFLLVKAEFSELVLYTCTYFFTFLSKFYFPLILLV